MILKLTNNIAEYCEFLLFKFKFSYCTYIFLYCNYRICDVIINNNYVTSKSSILLSTKKINDVNPQINILCFIMNKYTINTIQISLYKYICYVFYFSILHHIFFNWPLFGTNEFNNLAFNIIEADIIYFIWKMKY